MKCKNRLDDQGFCQYCAGGLPLKVCAALQLKAPPPPGTTLGFGLTAEEATAFHRDRKVTLKDRIIFGINVGKEVYLFETPANYFIGAAVVTNITPPLPAEAKGHAADVEVTAT